MLVFYTILRRGIESDPTKILIDYYTEAQTRAQELIDEALRAPPSPKGELLIIIPFRDRWDLTRSCLMTLPAQLLPVDLIFRTILVDNGSVIPETLEKLDSVKTDYPVLNIEVLKANYPFNYSRLNNEAFKRFRLPTTKWVLFLNNDVELRDQNIVSRMTTCLESIPEAGVIGCTLLYPNRRIQHIFAAPGVKIIAAHPLKGVPYNPSYEWFAKPARPVAAVTGAVMMVRAEDFEKVGMFDERLPTMGQDIDLCLALTRKSDSFSLALSSGATYHNEGESRKGEINLSEANCFYVKWTDYLKSPKLFSTAFTRWSERPMLRFLEPSKYPWRVFCRQVG